MRLTARRRPFAAMRAYRYADGRGAILPDRKTYEAQEKPLGLIVHGFSAIGDQSAYSRILARSPDGLERSVRSTRMTASKATAFVVISRNLTLRATGHLSQAA